MLYRCPKCGTYRPFSAWLQASGKSNDHPLAPFYCCPSCGEASATEELESFFGHWIKSFKKKNPA